MDEQLQQDITRCSSRTRTQLVEVHPAANALDAEIAQDIGFIETCPGAQSYFDEG